MGTELKKEFKDKLVELGVYEQWRDNVISRAKIAGYNLDSHISELNDESCFTGMIYGSFTWNITPEGYMFWKNISTK